jgi:hypothetical protein
MRSARRPSSLPSLSPASPLRRAVLVALLVLVAAACVPPPPFPPDDPPILRDARWGRHDTFDRFVLELSGPAVPPFELRWATSPVEEDASGEPVEVAGGAVLLVRLSPAFGYDPRTGEPGYTGPRRFPMAGTVLREAVLVGDFEGVLTWAIGVDHAVALDVRTARDPSRLILDFRT